MTTATAIMDNIVIGVADQISRVIPGTDDPLEEAEICRLDLETIRDPQQRQMWDGTNATSLVLKLQDGSDWQVHVIRVPPHLVKR